ncbi:MAG: outer membrane protein assembly factor BamA [Candidatus Omnitrophota bacterium]
MSGKITFLLFCFFAFLSAAFSFAAEEQRKITAIEVKGNKTISASVVLSRIKMRLGQKYSSNIARDDIKRLYNTGYFSDVRIELEGFKGGVRVVFALEEKPLIDKIVFSGARSIGRKKLKDTINSRKGQYLDYSRLNHDREEIEKLYQKRGFANAAVEYKVEDADEKGRGAARHSRVRFLIDEGRRMRVRKISILGAKAFPEKKILKLLKTKKRSWFGSGGILEEGVLEEDGRRIISFYNDKGFLDAKIARRDIKSDPRRGDVYITFVLEEGRQYKVGDVHIKGNTIAETEVLEKELSLSGGDIYNEQAIREEAAVIQEYYVDRGYIFARVDARTALNAQTGNVDVTYGIKESEPAYVRRINIQGNFKTKDNVIRRELRLDPGERFDGRKLKRSKERLYNLGFFQEIGFDMEDTAKRNEKDLVVEVKEAKTGEFSFGGGYSSVDQFIGFVEIAQKNFDFANWRTFTGAGQDLRLRAQLGSVSSNFELSWTDPWIFDRPLSFGFDAYNTARRRSSLVGYGYDEERAGGDLRFGKELSEFVRAGLTYRLEDVTIGNVPSDATDDLKSEEGSNLISSLGLNLTRDTRDNVFSPTRGTVISGLFQAAGGPLSGDKDFLKFVGRGVYDLPVSRVGKFNRRQRAKYSVLEFRARLGLVKEYGSSDNVPIYEKFYVGGSYSIRGYKERKVGPLDNVTDAPLGGEAMFVGNIEYTYPLMDVIKGAVFYDVGNVWSKAGDLGSGGFKAGAGLGVRLKTPIGPVRLDYGFPLNDEPGEDKRTGKFHFSVSRGF